MVDGTAYTGWLTDTDGHRYYFNKDGIMPVSYTHLDVYKRQVLNSPSYPILFRYASRSLSFIFSLLFYSRR